MLHDLCKLPALKKDTTRRLREARPELSPREGRWQRPRKHQLRYFCPNLIHFRPSSTAMP